MATDTHYESWGSSPAIPVTINFSASGSTLYVKTTIGTLSGSSYFGYPIYLDVTIAGTKVTNGLTLKAASPSTWSSAITNTSSANVSSSTVSVSVRLYSGSGSTRNQTYSYTVTITGGGGGGGGGGGDDYDPTPAHSASYLSEASGNSDILGQAQNFTISRETSSMRHTVTYECGSASGTIVSNSSSASFSWTPPLEIAAQCPYSTIANVTLRCRTTLSGSLIGETSLSLSLDIPASVKPSLSFALSDPTGNKTTFGNYVQSRSKVRVQNTETLAYGSPIVTRRITVSGVTSTVNPADMDLPASGSVVVNVSITDGRGRSATASQTITVIPYTSPTVTAITAVRCNAVGTSQSDGEYIKVTFSAVVTQLTGNTAAYAVKYKKLTDEYFTEVSAGNANVFTVTGATVIFSAGKNDAYNVYVQATDIFGASASTMIRVTSAGQKHIHIPGHGTSVAIGMLSTAREKFEEWWAAHFYDDIQVDGDLSVDGDVSADNVNATGDLCIVRDGEAIPILDLIYPVGAIYLSTQNTSPGDLFGGSWEQIKDRFLLTDGDTYTAGATGGNDSHTLTASELPSHTHSFSGTTGTESRSHTHDFSAVQRNTALTTLGSGSLGYETGASGTTDTESRSHTHTYSGTTDAAGDGDEFSIMPPYLVVYAWQRVS